ncbi:hypothetical protein [Garciella nitratireducens]|uniref:Uncharacterized protein n=1 Tax=Garciella nitratireducens DSM 15102 TaxID=1121911 RepID=A0A1T4JS98_9FIRM|nr:hypothetical protein [Garciella nitratireducens]RBP45519.1 hypothetical protein DFR81_10255 [Garciella nitratireducens]SJZ33013.1 hypothetical protein SAMN02745973_00041 [Garciella nitratireducens DSM 15102]
MNQFFMGLASITTTLQPIMIFIVLLAMIFFIFYIKKQIDLFIQYQKSMAISLQQIANQKSRPFKDSIK